jgi:hypothetical protein
MRRIALLTVVFTFAMAGVALAATVPANWYGDWTGSSDGPIGIEIGVNLSFTEVTNVDIRTKKLCGAYWKVGFAFRKWKLTDGKFSGTATVTGTGAKITVSGKRISGGYKGTYSLADGSCKSGTIHYTARSETGPRFG